MKPFQFYVLKEMPDLQPEQSISNQVQLTFSGEEEDVRTTITMKSKQLEGSFSLLHIVSGIRHKTLGYIKMLINKERRRIDFAEYLQPVDFEAYMDEERKLMIFQAPKKVCRGVLSHLRARPCGIELAEMDVDFTKVTQQISEYLGAWFRQVSARVQAAGLSGHQIQDDALFKSLSKIAALSNVTIPWPFEGVEHSVMVTCRAGVVLIQSYQGNVGLELRLVMDVYEKLLQNVWHERGTYETEDENIEET